MSYGYVSNVMSYWQGFQHQHLLNCGSAWLWGTDKIVNVSNSQNVDLASMEEDTVVSDKNVG